MTTHTERIVFNMSRPIIIGWPETFSLNGTPEDDMICRRFWFKTPCDGAFKLKQLVTTRHGSIEFTELGLPWSTIAEFPGNGFDPHILPAPCGIGPLAMGPSHKILDISDVRMRIEYTGKVPPGMKAGEKYPVVVMFIGSAP